MIAKVVIFCAALAAAHASLLAAPLVSTGVSAESRQQDAFGNYAYAYDIRDGATGSINSKAEVGKAAAIAVAAPAIAAPLAYDAPLGLGHGALGLGYGAGLGYGVGLGHGALGLGYGALGLGHGALGLGKVLY
ncbi:hypothetical protein HNY73_009217 [Argiope bruennichi]|uniref:Uncharacterized protein n=1 Tax=Argiope bruennichi TaxID=94029 RepID=A0A8T0FDZ7_ARGBR|nr:hypothetical protein HNY73_009217 [Argiope bruennichi]